MYLRVLFFCACLFSSQNYGAAAPIQKALTIGFINPVSLSFKIESVDNFESVFIIKQIAQSLLDQGPTGKIIPSVAKYWTISKDMKTYDFHIHRDLQFSDGSKLTAKDVEYSINTIKNSNINPLNIYLKRISSISVTDEYTIRIELSKPWFGFLYCLSSGLSPIFSAHSHRSKGDFVGSGAYFLANEKLSWFFIANPHYKGFYRPIEDRFKILTESGASQPDILIKDLANFPGFSDYKKIDIDSLTSYSFMINPNIEEWQNIDQRLMLSKAILEAKEIVKTSRLLDSKDVFPKGMLGFDFKHESFDELLRKSEHVDPSRMKKKVITIASLGPIFNFEKLAIRLKEKYGIMARNFTVNPPNYLEKMLANQNIDIFTVGWASIFLHPDASFVPFYILGIKKNIQLSAVIRKIDSAATISDQFKNYRRLSHEAIANAFIIPHSQVAAEIFIKPTVEAPIYRYRYSLQIAEIKRSN